MKLLGAGCSDYSKPWIFKYLNRNNNDNLIPFFCVYARSSLNWWTSDECNMINGTNGASFHPVITKDEMLYMFSSDLCRWADGKGPKSAHIYIYTFLHTVVFKSHGCIWPHKSFGFSCLFFEWCSNGKETLWEMERKSFKLMWVLFGFSLSVSRFRFYMQWMFVINFVWLLFEHSWA